MEARELLKKVRKIEIKSRGLSRDIFAGHYHSAFKGRGMAFSEVREYQPGDDIRNIDWNVTARFSHPYVKVYEEERELTVMLLIDTSGSREFGTSGMLKKNMMTEIAAVLSFSAIHNNDKIGVIFFSNKVEKFIPPKKGRKHILHIIRELIDFVPENRGTDLAGPLKYLTNAIKKRSTAFLISDFLVKPGSDKGDNTDIQEVALNNNGFEDTLRIAARKHDLVAIRIYDGRERELPPVGMIRMRDSETGGVRWVDTLSKGVRRQYSAWWQMHDKWLSELFARNGIDAVKISTSEDYVKPLINLFKRR
ncbi:MAG: DUF58 domain-containing protein [Marinilabiliales bacterium]|nr:MAG: DUF58 domain-containing protein [Marinilabiliales bacterium]